MAEPAKDMKCKSKCTSFISDRHIACTISPTIGTCDEKFMSFVSHLCFVRRDEIATALAYFANEAARYTQATAFLGLFFFAQCLRMACAGVVHVVLATANSIGQAAGSRQVDGARWRMLRTRYTVDESRRQTNGTPQQKIFRLGDWEDELEDDDECENSFSQAY